MKKIVALVLSLVMVLGLAVTASAVTVTYDVWNSDGEKTMAVDVEYDVVDATYNPAIFSGSVEYVTIDSDVSAFWAADPTFVECAKVDADFYLTLNGKKDAVMYLKQVDNVVYQVGYEMNDIGTACGQLNVNAKYDYYYTLGADGVTKTYYKGVGDTGYGATKALMVGGELVQVVASPAADVNAHVWQIEAVDADHEVTDISCKVCKAAAKIYDTKLAAPAGAFPTDFGWAALVAVEAPETDKVESAQTFDAGIAMYVGMSVMAAAGSAVVLKKKD